MVTLGLLIVLEAVSNRKHGSRGPTTVSSPASNVFFRAFPDEVTETETRSTKAQGVGEDASRALKEWGLQLCDTDNIRGNKDTRKETEYP